MNEYPELEKQRDIQDKADLIADFLDFLDSKHLFICHFSDTHPWVVSTQYASDRSRSELLAEFFKLDINKLDAEREALYQAVRKEANGNAEQERN